MDIYSTRAQLAAIDLMEREYTFLFDSFCTDLGAVESDKAIYDYRRGVESLAPVVHDGVGGQPADSLLHRQERHGERRL